MTTFFPLDYIIKGNKMENLKDTLKTSSVRKENLTLLVRYTTSSSPLIGKKEEW